MKNKIIIMILTLFFCFFIYKFTNNNEKLYLALGDGACNTSSILGTPLDDYNNITFNYLNQYNKADVLNKDFCYKNLRVDELIRLIKENKRVSNHSIQTLIHDAAYITIMIGYDELTSYKNVDNIKKRDFLNSYNELLKIIKKYQNGKVFVIGFYSNIFDKSSEINLKIKQFSINNNYTYIDTSNLLLNSSILYSKNSYELNSEGHLKLFKIIKNYI